MLAINKRDVQRLQKVKAGTPGYPRALALVALSEGASYEQAIESVRQTTGKAYSKASVSNWVKAYKEDGISVVLNARPLGRPPVKPVPKRTTKSK